jgi:hypothetical protein
MLHHKDQTFCQMVRFSAPGASPMAHSLRRRGDQTVEKDCQFGCLNFSYKSGVVSPVTAYRNKWPSDWQQQWLYHTVTPLAPGELHPLATKELPPSTIRIQKSIVP